MSMDERDQAQKERRWPCCEVMGQFKDHPSIEMADDGCMYVYPPDMEPTGFPFFSRCPWCFEPLAPFRPSQPPGATQTPNSGVGMGSEEKVAQDGRYSELGPVHRWMLGRISFLEHRVAELEAGGVEEGWVKNILKQVGELERKVDGDYREVSSVGGLRETVVKLCNHFQAHGARLGNLEGRVEALEKERRGNGLFISDEDDSPEAEHYRNSRDVEEEMAKRGVNFSPGFTQIFTEEGARKYGLDPEKLGTGLREMRNRYRKEGDEAQGRMPSRRPPCDCPHEMRSDCATHNLHPYPDPPFGLPVPGIDFSRAASKGVGATVVSGEAEESLDALSSLAEKLLPTPGEKWLWDPPDPKYRQEVEINAVRWNGEEFWVETSSSKGGVGTTAWNNLDRLLEVARPCSPAPPPCAEPAEAISSGGESCGEGTAGGACCSWMAMAKKRHWATVGEESGCTFLCLYDGDDSVGPDHDEVISFCPWCASPLREDGELKVGDRPLSPGEAEPFGRAARWVEEGGELRRLFLGCERPGWVRLYRGAHDDYSAVSHEEWISILDGLGAEMGEMLHVSIYREVCIHPVEGRDTCKKAE